MHSHLIMVVVGVAPASTPQGRFQRKAVKQIKVDGIRVVKPTAQGTLSMKLSTLTPWSLFSSKIALMSPIRCLSRHLRSSNLTSSSSKSKTCLWSSSRRKMINRLRRIVRSLNVLKKQWGRSYMACQRQLKRTNIAPTKSLTRRRCWRCRQVRKVMVTSPTPFIFSLRSRSVK